MTSDELSKSWLGPKIDNLVQATNGKLINMNSNLNDPLKLQSLMVIDKEKYIDYIDKYLKMPNSPEKALWEIFTQNMKNNF